MDPVLFSKPLKPNVPNVMALDYAAKRKAPTPLEWSKQSKKVKVESYDRRCNYGLTDWIIFLWMNILLVDVFQMFILDFPFPKVYCKVL